ncbi:hypothetical protein AZI86_07650 [Bdellovibrio bacteriovorus]|uniref:Fimbrial biogenesis outer membrane usher protein n=1 Tax=Bdellovibrio bacteriovorus TaxID=959 RepID=A0A150WRA0_BDEBC|nr:fimbria/pilus outer membrane usher protein [Bdellovibrio bacteriovorus]KYG66896.1 hypothetical protein AZI86_07650 [Bdellovibrio bacteriovorus]
MRFLIFLFSFLTILSAHGQSVRPALAKPYFVAPVILDKKAIVEVWIFPRDERRQFSIEAKPLLEALKSYVPDSTISLLKQKTSPQGVISLVDLESVGISTHFDESRLDITLAIPIKHRKKSDLDLNYIEIDDQKFLRPSGHSGYLNLRTQQSYRYGEVETEKLPLNGHLDFVENIHGYVLESMADFTEGDQYPWRRQDTRLRFDNEDKMIRYTLGDLTLGARGFQQAPNVAGLSVVREFSIQPYKTLRPLSNTEIVIKRSSLLEIYVNGFLYSQLRMAPGIFNIRDFPLATGQNSVKVRIRDDLGQEETYDFSVLFENTLLGKGIQEFSYSVGLPWTESGADRAYNDKASFLSAYHRWGVSDQATVGLNFQNYLSKTMAGGEVSGIVNWGYLSLDAGFAGQGNKTQGFAQRFRYRSLDRMYGVDLPLLFSLEAENRDEAFQAVSVSDLITNNYVQRYDTQISLRHNDGWVFGVGAGRIIYVGNAEQDNYRANLIVPLTRQARIEFGYQRSNPALPGQDQDRGLVSFNWLESQGRYSASAYYDSLNRNTNINLNRNAKYRYDDFNVLAAFQNSDSTTSGNLTAEYLAQPFSLRLDHFTSQQNSTTIHNTGLGLNTALVWAGSHVSLSQPIADSFVIVSADRLPAGQELLINPLDEKGEAQLGPRRTTVVRDMSGYYKYFINVDSTSLPIGYLLDQEFYPVQPTYRSGIAIDLNLQRRIMVRGRLVDKDHQPVAYLAGDIVNAKGELVDNTFFTNKDGGFLIDGLEPGSYKMMTGQGSWKTLEFEVADHPKNILNLGEITLEEAR